MSNESDWFTVAGSARYTSYSTWTIRKFIRDGRLRAYRPAGSRLLRIRRDDLDELITGSKQDSLADRIRRAIADHGDEMPDLTDAQIRTLARLLPPPSRAAEDRAS